MLRLIALFALAIAPAAQAQDRIETERDGSRALAPLDFLVGHCWRGTLPNGDSDVHCFKAAEGSVSDHHEVARAGKTFYSGDSVYGWTDGAIRWTYTDVGGGVMKGSVRGADDGLDFGTADYVGPDGAKITIATHWARIGDAAYEVRDRSTLAAHNRTTRYVKID